MAFSFRCKRGFMVLLYLFCIAFPVASQNNNFIAGYHLGWKCLLLGDTLKGSESGLKDFNSLTPTEIATIYHELWHAWFIEVESKRKGTLFEYMNERVDTIYAEFPDDKRMEIYEEAVADLIDATVETYMQVRRLMARRTPEQRERVRNHPDYFQNTWVRLFEDKHNGYYTKTVTLSTNGKDKPTTDPLEQKSPPLQEVVDARKTLEPFIEAAKKEHLPVIYISEAVQALEGVVYVRLKRPRVDGVATDDSPIADVVFVNVYLTDDEIATVSRLLFENKLVKDPGVVFIEESFSDK